MMRKFEKRQFQAKNVSQDGASHVIANGYIGYRGTLEEYTKDQWVQLNLNGIYDQSGNLPRESVNAYNPLFIQVVHDKQLLHPLVKTPLNHVLGTDLDRGLVYRKTAFKVKDATITLASERFMDQTQPELMFAKMTISASESLDVTIDCGIDLDVFNSFGNHLNINEIVDEVDFFFVRATTKELKIPVVVGETTSRNFSDKGEVVKDDGRLIRRYRVNVSPEKDIIIEKFMGVCHSRKDSYTYLDTLLTKAQKLGYTRKYQANEAFWRDRWAVAKIEMPKNADLELAMAYQTYQLISARPYANHVSIPPGGLSGQGNGGAVMWDTELLMLPFFINTDPPSALRMIRYRIQGLQGARDKATSCGYEGAFYAWASQENNREAGRIIDSSETEHNHIRYRDKDLHVNGAIVYGLNLYLSRMDDPDILFEGGLELVLECARFYLAYARYDTVNKCYEVLDVTGPDEYHHRVNHDAYTSFMFAYVYETALNLISIARKKDREKAKAILDRQGYMRLSRRLRSALEKMRPLKAEPNHMIEAFPGYFALEDISIKNLKRRLKHPQDPLGGPNGLAKTTQIVRQAGIITLMALFPERFTRVEKRANLTYYEPRTDHGSTLNFSMLTQVASEIDQANDMYAAFLRNAQIDMLRLDTPSQVSIPVDSHLSAAAASYLALIYGFCGLKHAGKMLTVDTRLPSKIKDVRFKVIVKGRMAHMRVQTSSATVQWEDEGK